MALFCQSFEQCCLQNIVVCEQAVLTFRFVGLEGLVPRLPNAKCWGRHATEAGHCPDFVKATRLFNFFCHF